MKFFASFCHMIMNALGVGAVVKALSETRFVARDFSHYCPKDFVMHDSDL